MLNVPIRPPCFCVAIVIGSNPSMFAQITIPNLDITLPVLYEVNEMVSSNKGSGIGTASPFGSASMVSFSIENSVWSLALVELNILVPCCVRRSSERRISKEFENFIGPEYGLFLFSLSFTMLLLNLRTLDYSARAVCTSYRYCYSHKLSLRAFIKALIILILSIESKTKIIHNYFVQMDFVGVT